MKPKIHYRVHKCPPPVPVVSNIDPVRTPTSHSLKTHLNIMVPSSPGSPKWSLSLRYPRQNPEYVSPLPQTRYMPRLSHYPPFYCLNIIGSLSSSLCSFFHFPVTSSLLDQIFSLTPYSQTTLAYVSPSM